MSTAKALREIWDDHSYGGKALSEAGLRTIVDAADEIEGLRQALADVGGWASYSRDDKAAEVLRKIKNICDTALNPETTT